VNPHHVPSGKRRALLNQHAAGVSSITFPPEGGLMVTASQDRTTRLWHVTETGVSELFMLTSPSGSVSHVEFSADGKALYTLARGELAVRVWHLVELRKQFGQLELDWK
jgi:WD40 repeat protein